MQDCVIITGLQYIDDYQLELRFSDGLCGVFDLRGRIVGRGGVFHALEDLDYFRTVRLDAELGTIVWPNGADFCPDMLHDIVTCQHAPTVLS